MAAAICLVGINAVFTGGDCHPAVLQNWSLLVSAKVRWQPVWAGWAPVSPGTTASAWAHGACILPSPVIRQALPQPQTTKVRQNVNNREFCFLGLLVATFCFETVSYYVAQTSLNLDFPASASLALEKFCVPPPPPPRLTISHTMTFSSKAGIMTYGESHT